jgi:hypothetical protein
MRYLAQENQSNMNNNQRSFHRKKIGNQYHVWYTDELWQLSQSLKVREIAPEEVIDLDRDGWFSKDAPTPRNILNHMKRILEADLAYPIILNSDGLIMDGAHRACKAILLDLKTVKVVQFENPPTPSEVVDL